MYFCPCLFWITIHFTMWVWGTLRWPPRWLFRSSRLPSRSSVKLYPEPTSLTLKICRNKQVKWAKNSKRKMILLRVIPNLTHYSDIVSDISSGSICWHIYSDILSKFISGIQCGIYSDILYGIYSGMHLCCLCWHSFWHSISHLFWHSILHKFWHALWYLAI